jgi:hypothetical protein
MRQILLAALILSIGTPMAQTVLNDGQIKRVFINLPVWNMEATQRVEVSLPTGAPNPSHILNLSASIYSDLFNPTQGEQPIYTEVYRFDRIPGYVEPVYLNGDINQPEIKCSEGCATLGGNIYVAKNASGAWKIILDRGYNANLPLKDQRSFFKDFNLDPAIFSSTTRSRGVVEVEYY